MRQKCFHEVSKIIAITVRGINKIRTVFVKNDFFFWTKFKMHEQCAGKRLTLSLWMHNTGEKSGAKLYNTSSIQKSHSIFNVSFRGYLNPSTGWVTWASRSSPTTLSLSFEKSLTAWFTYKQIIAVRIIKPYQNIRRRFSVHKTSGKEHKPLGTRFQRE